MKYRMMGKEIRPVKNALVLSGGGAKGAYQVGVIKGMLARGIKPDLVTGSSIGAFNGVLLAEFIHLGLSNTQIAKRLEGVWMKIDDFLTFNWYGILSNLFTPFDIPSIYTNKMIKRVLNSYIPRERKFSDYTSCQLSVTGTNLNKKELTVFDFNSAVPVNKAVLASMAYPVALPSVRIGKDHYIDGGALDNAPLKEAILWGARNIYVIFLKPLHLIEGGDNNGGEEREDFSALDVIEEFVDLAASKLMYGDLHKAEKLNQLIKLLNKYEKVLPRGFLSEIRRLFGLKFGDGKRIIRIVKIAPDKVLEPPGTMGFDQKEAIAELILKGERDAGKWLRQHLLSKRALI